MSVIETSVGGRRSGGRRPGGRRTGPRTLHVIDTGGPGGAETVFVQLVQAAQLRGENIGAVVPYEGWLAKRLRSVGVDALVQSSKGTFNFALFACLRRLMRAGHGELLHAHLLGSSVYAALVGMVVGAPVVAVFHGASDLEGVGALLSLKRWLLRRPHVSVVAVSDAVRDALITWGLPADRVRIIINGVDTRQYAPGRSRLLHEELGLPDHARIVGAVGNIRKAKAYDVFVRTAAEVHRRMPDVHFVVAGEGAAPDMTALHDLSAQLGVTANLHFLGFRSEGAALHRCFDVFASSAASEGLPLSFLEAMACGVPIAATANAGAQSLLLATGGGLLAPVGDAAALADSIVMLLEDSAHAANIAAAGRSAVERDYSLAVTLQQYADLCATLVADRQRAN